MSFPENNDIMRSLGSIESKVDRLTRLEDKVELLSTLPSIVDTIVKIQLDHEVRVRELENRGRFTMQDISRFILTTSAAVGILVAAKSIGWI